MSTPIRVSIVSEDLTLRSMLVSVLGPQVVASAESRPEQVAQQASANMLDAILFDIDLEGTQPHVCGKTAFERVASCGVPLIILAGDESRRRALGMVQQGAYGYVRKPPVVPELRAVLRSAHEKRSLAREVLAVKEQLEGGIVGLDQMRGSSAPMQLVYKLIRKVANLDASVLITGESGTGKELIAQAIHNVGNRARKPFIAVSCGAIPENLIEAELFGHEKGAFTGSVGVREGYFEKAGDGTLFLDEIGELNQATQVKLLRVLQEREFSRLGSSRPIPLRARIIFATHRDLQQMVAEGGFRQDLFYRVNVMKISSPALRQHAEDIPSLVHHFLRRYAQQFGNAVEGIEPEALDLLQRYSWPGNVRELENAMQRAIIMAEGSSIEIADLPERIQDQEPRDFEETLGTGTFDRLVREYKFKLAFDAVEQSNGNKTVAAQSLSISRAYLHRLLRQPGTPNTSVTEFPSRPAELAG